MCEQSTVNVNMNIEAAPRPRYHVGANKAIYVSASFDSIEEAVAEASRLALEGYDIVSVRDNHVNQDVW